VAAVDPFPYEEEGAFIERLRGWTEPPLLLTLDSVQDPRNLGAMVRCANTVGAQGVILPKDRSAGVTAAAAKASQKGPLRQPCGDSNSAQNINESIDLRERGQASV
jgi:tRNA G18 (ribose-2'-O)-methylase SpoU